MRMKRISYISLFIFVGLSLVTTAFFYSSSSWAAPVITWTPSSVSEAVAPGESKTVPISFTASENLSNVVVRVVPELQPYIHTDPAVFGSVAKGQTINIKLIISAPANSQLGLFEGTVQLRNVDKTSKTYAKPLPLEVNICRCLNERNISLNYPQNWQPDFKLSALNGPTSLNNFASAYEQGGIIPENGAAIDITTIPLPPSPLDDVIAKDLQGVQIESTSVVLVGGKTGTEVIYIAEFLPIYIEKTIVVYVPHNELLYKFFLSYNAGDPLESQFVDDFYRTLSSVQFMQ